MKTRAIQVAFGLSVGLAARTFLPGHHPGNWVASVLVSAMGATAGRVAAVLMLPPEMEAGGGFFMAGIGSLAALLFQAVVVR